MKVLFITHCTTMGGANQSMLQLIKELKTKYNVDIDVIIPKDNNREATNSIITYLNKENIQYITTRFNWFKSPNNQGKYIKFKNVIRFFINLNTKNMI